MLAVLRRPKRSTDVIRPRSKDPKKRRALAALPSRLLWQAQDFKIYLVPSGNQLCVWEQGRNYGASGCQPVSQALRPAKPAYAGDIGVHPHATVLMLDGTHDVQHIAPDGTVTPVTVDNNAVHFLGPSTGQLTWQTANGDQASMRLP